MIYFTSDLHLGHKNILKLCNRPFASIEEMDSCLIENWNSRVTNNDTVYILGDLIFRSSVPPEEYLKKLKGKKHFIRGNHDRDWIKKVNIDDYFVSNENLAYITDGKHRITVCHYAMMSWPHMSSNGYMIFGHIHQNTDAIYWPLIEMSELMLNAGVDINGYKPVTFDELIENNNEHKKKYLDSLRCPVYSHHPNCLTDFFSQDDTPYKRYSSIALDKKDGNKNGQ